MPTLSLLVLRAREPRRLAEFYAALGLTFTEERHDTGPLHFVSKAGAATIEIYPSTEQASSTASARIGFTVACLDDALSTPALMRAKMLSHPSDSPWGRRAVVQDPEGHKVELVEESR